MPRVGIMQGRLLPPEGDHIQLFPREGWEREFELAAAAGLACIEWIYDIHGEGANPLESDEGIERLRELASGSGVDVRSVCADWFMARPLAKGDAGEPLERLAWLIGRCGRAGIGRIVLPFVDASSLAGPEDEDRLVRALDRVAADAERAGVELHLETDLAPEPFAALLARLPEGRVFVNYDSGNSASLGYGAAEELEAYGERIGSVHVKDRLRGGATVPLGAGDADFPALAAGLRALRYERDVILQVARGEPGGELALARANLAFVEGLLG